MGAEADLFERQRAFAAHIRDPERVAAPPDIEDRRMAIYRELFYNNMQSFLATNFPVLRQLYDEKRWQQLVRDFYARHRSQSPLFAEIPREFLHYLERERGAPDTDPPFLRELAHYEWIELALTICDAAMPQGIDPDGNLINGAPVLSPLAWPLAYRFPVHRIGPDYQPQDVQGDPTYLLAYRDREERVGFVELNPVSARLIALLQERAGITGRAALNTICTELAHPSPQAVIDGGSDILNQWRRLGIVLGTDVRNSVPPSS
jgi:hypothetical protein